MRAGRKASPAPTIGGIPTVRLTRAELADLMVQDSRRARASAQSLPKVIVASNGSVISKYHRDASFRALVDQADIIDPDGMPLVFATRLLWREPLRERVATTDFIHDAAAAAAQNGIRFYFLGAKPGVAEKAATILRQRYPALQIVGTRDGYFKDADIPGICEAIRAAGTDVLWLGLGSPKQEAFAIANRSLLNGVAWIRTCGGMFDHQSGAFPRAPMWMQKAGLEWLHRATLEPGRLGLRYFSTNPRALYHLVTKTRD